MGFAIGLYQDSCFFIISPSTKTMSNSVRHGFLKVSERQVITFMWYMALPVIVWRSSVCVMFRGASSWVSHCDVIAKLSGNWIFDNLSQLTKSVFLPVQSYIHIIIRDTCQALIPSFTSRMRSLMPAMWLTGVLSLCDVDMPHKMTCNSM